MSATNDSATVGRLDSVESVMDALGGRSAVRRLTGDTPQTVQEWRRRKQFPANKFLMMTEALRAAGRVADAKLWGQK